MKGRKEGVVPLSWKTLRYWAEYKKLKGAPVGCKGQSTCSLVGVGENGDQLKARIYGQEETVAAAEA